MLPAEGLRRDAEAAPFYGLEAIMAGTAYAEGWGGAEASLVAEMHTEERSYFSGSAQVPKSAPERVAPAEAPRRDAEAVPFYGMEAIMAAAAYTEDWEGAEASLVAEMRNEEH